MHVTDLTQSQLQSYRSIWGSFTDFGWTFAGPERTFGFYGRLRVDETGSIDLLDLCVACSGKHSENGPSSKVLALKKALRRSQSKPEERDQFRVEFISGATHRGTTDSHLVLTYGNADDLRNHHFEQFRPKPEASGNPLIERSHYYPVSQKANPADAREVSLAELSNHLSQNPAIAITGAGISTGSGIPSFRGEKGLERHFPLHEPFPGTVANLMIEEPRRLAQILTQFQAAFIQAEPNAAHKALAQLEEIGTIRRIITGNDDKLHERARSRRVHLKSHTYFESDGKGWDWLKEGKILLAIGLGRDEHGLISYCRDQGTLITAISPNRPEFLHQEDLYLKGKAEDTLPHLKERCLNYTTGESE